MIEVERIINCERYPHPREYRAAVYAANALGYYEGPEDYGV